MIKRTLKEYKNSIFGKRPLTLGLRQDTSNSSLLLKLRVRLHSRGYSDCPLDGKEVTEMLHTWHVFGLCPQVLEKHLGEVPYPRTCWEATGGDASEDVHGEVLYTRRATQQGAA